MLRSMVHSKEFYQHYHKIYNQYKDQYGPKTIVFYMKGSFYEFYGMQDVATLEYKDPVKEVCEFLNIECTFTPYDVSPTTHGLFSGVPEYTLHKHAGKLTLHGWTVVVVDQVKEGDKVVDRVVSQVLSPGTHMENLQGHKSSYVVSIYILHTSNDEPPSYGIVAMDLSTGQIIMHESQASGYYNSWNMDSARHFLQVYNPAECIYMYQGPNYMRPCQDTLRQMLQISHIPIYEKHEYIQGNFQNYIHRENYLRHCFQPKTLLPLRAYLQLGQNILCEQSLCGLLQFVEQHNPSFVHNCKIPQLWNPKDHVQILNNALQQINILPTEANPFSVYNLFISPYTSMGKRALRQVLCKPYTNVTTLQTIQNTLDWFINCDSSIHHNLQKCFTSIYDLPRLHRNFVCGSITPNELVQLYQSYVSIQFLCEILQPSFLYDATIHAHIQAMITSFQQIFSIEKLEKSQKSPDDYGCLQETYGPQSHNHETTIQTIYKNAQSWLQTLYTHIKSLDEKTLSQGLYFKEENKNCFSLYSSNKICKELETLKGKKNSAYNSFYIYKLKSSAKVEHPELQVFHSQLQEARHMLQESRKDELLEATLHFVKAHQEKWEVLEYYVTSLDVYNSMAKTSQKYGWVKPQLVENKSASFVNVESLRHPLIEIQQSSRTKLVCHNITLDEKDSGMLLYGMNASGKSSLMKALGISILLAQVGCYVPAVQMTLQPFHKIATRILNQDNLWAGLSSFAVEVRELRDIFSVCDQNTLVLGDELCAGTESVSATSIVAAGIEYLQSSKSKFMLASHLHDLMKLPIVQNPSLQVYHLKVYYDPSHDCLVYDRSLQPGPGNTYYGLEVAKALHMNHNILEHAQRYRHMLLGTTATHDATHSAWNKQILRKECELCKHPITKDLEVHHIQQRKDAENQYNRDGTYNHDVRNLVVVCQSCHDAHHAGELQITPLVDTSHGPQRLLPTMIPAETKVNTKTKVTNTIDPQQLSIIQKVYQENKLMHPRLLVLQLKKENVIMDEKSLKKILKTIADSS